MSTSLEQTFSQKLTLDKAPLSISPSSSSGDNPSTTQQHSLSVSPCPTAGLSGSGGTSPVGPGTNAGAPSALTPSNESVSKLSFKNIGRRSLSPIQTQPSLIREDSLGNCNSPGTPNSPSQIGSQIHQRGSFAHSAGQGSVDSSRVTRKIFHNWRSACGRTKDKTKDFIRRWKTLPENHPDFDHLNSPTGSTSNINSGISSHHGESSLQKIRNLTKKHSENEISFGSKTNNGTNEDVGPGGGHSKSSTGWSVHVWATYVQRGSCEEITNEEEPPGRDFLSDFQKVKLTHFLRHVLDMNHDDVISADDFVALNQRIRHYIEWSNECIEFHILKEVHSGFLECFLNQPLDDCSHMYYCSSERETRHHVAVEEWLDVWGVLLHSARSLESLPLWLQYFPKILFQVINKSGSGTISKEELRAFYTMFLGIDFRVVNETLDSIYSAMTDGSRYKITYSLFKLCFANFLLGKYPHGPGQYLFGICSPQTLRCSFPIDYSALNTPPDDLEPYDPEKDKSQCNRRSVIV